MITLDLNVNSKFQKIKIKDDILFNAVLAEHPKIIKKIIKEMSFSYSISEAFFTIVNKFVDFNENGESLYPGLIIRTGIRDYAVLYLENSNIDEEYMIKLIQEFIYDAGDINPKEVNINKFEVDKKTFLSAIKKI